MGYYTTYYTTSQKLYSSAPTSCRLVDSQSRRSNFKCNYKMTMLCDAAARNNYRYNNAIHKGRCHFADTMSSIKSHKLLPVQTKMNLLIYETVIRPALLYGCKTRPINDKQIRQQERWELCDGQWVWAYWNIRGMRTSWRKQGCNCDSNSHEKENVGMVRACHIVKKYAAIDLGRALVPLSR